MPSPIPVQSSSLTGGGLVGCAAGWTSADTAPEISTANSITSSDNAAEVVTSMSPEEEQSGSPVTGVIAGRDEEERRLTSPPSGSKFDSVASKPDLTESESWANSSDVEKFDGKIVYNPDGSAYIIEDNSELSEEDGVDLPSELLGSGSIVDGRGVNLSQAEVFPQIANAFYVSRANYGDLYDQQTNAPAAAALNRVFQDKKIVPEVPVMHSYRVYTVRDKTGNGTDMAPEQSKDCSTVPVKPILMCFICKLSFGYAKSFVAHATGEHGVTLQEDEYNILGHKNASAIIQCVGKEKEPLVSFLEPLALSSNKAYARASSPSSAHKVPNAFNNDGNRSSDSSEQKSSCPESLVVHRRNATPPTSSPSINTVPETSVSLPQSGSPRNNVNSFSISKNNNCSSKASGRSSVYDCIMDLTRKSPISALAVSSGTSARSNSASPGASPSPGTTLSPQLISGAPLSYPQPPPNFMTGTTIGVCPDHMNGRPSGVDCARCELILSSSRLGGVGGSLVGMHSRNSCKTLKCPKCNWHYKYQETLEIHMKEKHPESETSCVYCIAGQPHPRLARGETYTCGYKPYRCEVCNYSTTTKGNLSIHMQSDKHLNNMQELQNGGVAAAGNASSELQRHQASSPLQHPKQSSAMSPGSTSSQHPAMNSPLISQKPKPTFRCEVCNYETNVARNLRIHMTSEKHTHNIMVLQQSVKHMQTLNALQNHHQQQMNFESLMHFHPGLTLSGDKPPPHSEAALADMAYNQALLIQMMTGGQMPPHFSGEVSPHVDTDIGLNPETMEPPPEPVDKNPNFMFQCSTCSTFVTDSLDSLSHHLAADRTKVREQEILTVVAGNYICNLCTYKTNLKANFQLHCKTDKHLQRLQHVNHVKEGGLQNEWKLKYMSSPGGVQVRCNACDYYTNSTHKLQLHCSGQRHEAASLLFRYLRDNEVGESSVYHCLLCEFSSRDKLPLLQHVRSVKHMQMEQLHQLQRRSDGKDVQTDITMVFQVTAAPQQSASVDSDQEQDREIKGDNDSHNMLSIDETRGDDSELMDQSYVASESPKISGNQEQQTSSSDEKKPELYCPLCQDVFEDIINFEKHLMKIHSVNSEGLQRLLSLVNQSHWLNSSKSSQQSPPRASTSPSSPDLDKSAEKSDDAQEQDGEEYKCPTCQKLCKNIDDLCQHQNETGHVEIKQTPNGPGYLCWKKGCNMYFTTVQNLHIHFREMHAGQQNILVSEKHVYKYRCNQCSLAFKTLDKLQAHSQYHAIRDLTKCILCRRSFRTVATFQKHLQTAHPDLSQADLEALKQNSMLQFDQSIDDKMEVDESMDDEEEKEEEPECDNSDDSIAFKQQQLIEDYMNGQTLAEDGYNDSERKYKCHRCKVAFTNQKYLTHHNKTLLHRKGEKQTYPMEKYLDPNRPFKCEVCKESFTQKNILLVHYNSVLHLHKLKRSMQEQQQQLNNNNTPILSNNSAFPVNLASKNTGGGSTSEDDDKKPYKCNICKVAYTQGSTLDIHMRSVLHQTRASKLHDLALAGQVDLTKPIIEQPEQSSRPPSQNKQDAESQVSGGKPMDETLTQQTHQTKGNQLSCQRCNALFSNQEQLNTHQQLYCMFGTPMNILPMNPALAFANNLTGGAQDPKSPSQLTLTEEQLLKVPLSLQGKKHSHMYKLLESYGFDLVMQFNENHQKRKENEKLLQELTAQMEMEQANAVKVEMNNEVNEEEISDLPEVAKSICVHCNKEFSSVWVLKAHCEEVHKDLVPFDFLEKYAKQIKCEIEKKGNEPPSANISLQPTSTSVSTATTPVARINSPADDVSVKTELDQDSEQQTDNSDFNASSSAADSSSVNIPGVSQNIPLSVAQHLNEMQAAFNAMAASQITQQLQQFNPMMVAQMAGLGMGLPLGLNMQALAAMNLQPPLVPMMMPPPNFESIMGQQQSQLFNQQTTNMDPTGILAKQQQLLQQQQQQVQNSQQKRARTRITDDQLKILRAHFDINNSPSEDQIQEMASQSGLPPKVIKHWFRNTLFKERQRNKDSPYNFNNPPSTTLNLEEYEKTGEAKVMPLAQPLVESENKEVPKTPTFPKKKPMQTSTPNNSAVRPQCQTPTFPQQQSFAQNFSRPFTSQPMESPVKIENQVKTEMKDAETSQNESKFPWCNAEESSNKRRDSVEEKVNMFMHHDRASQMDMNTVENLTLSSILTSQHQEIANMSNSIATSNMLPPKLVSSSFTSPPQMTSTTQSGPRSVSPGRSPNSSDGFPHSIMMNQSSGGSSGSASGKRANRTRFTDCQIKVLQEFFENNAYPKDDDLEYLSKLLNLSPRVIVVWFQNARQKARKVYENQPAVEPAPGIVEEGSNRFQRTPGLNYQCNKCLLVFQRYYELIRHQKTHCFKEEDAKRSAQAQAAAAHIAAALSSEDSNSSTVENHQSQSSNPMTPTPTPMSSTPTLNYPTSPPPSSHDKENVYSCDHCNSVFSKLDQWKEHQQVHLLNPNLFPTYHPESAFGILQQQAQLQQQQQQLQQQSQQMSGSSEMSPNPTSLILSMMQQNNKRSFDEFDDQSDKETEFTKDKRLRTTILPEQLDYLYQKYQIESNPSRKMLESIAQEVGLKKRVVQVWFQNTRARERKGQFRAHSQAINKRCPFCSAIFKIKSALESHLQTKHPEQCSRGYINVDNIPDEDVSMDSFASSQMSELGQKGQSFVSNPYLQNAEDVENLGKMYQESLKRYMEEMQQSSLHNGLSAEGEKTKPEGEIPLDLSKPVDLRMDHDQDDDDDSMSECTDIMDDESPASPASSTQSGQQRNNAPGGSHQSKRYRTQMSNVQVRVMKALFEDYKTPTMGECEMLGREIGLAKRVVQVWFQNARAKEKKYKLQSKQGQDTVSGLPEECKYCRFKYSHKYSIQDHIFTSRHIALVKQHVESRMSVADMSGNCSDNDFQVPSTPGDPHNNNLPNQQVNQLQMLQLAGLIGQSPVAQAVAMATIAKLDGKDQSQMTAEELALLPHLYNLGVSFQQGFMHPGTAMMTSPAASASNGTNGLRLDQQHRASSANATTMNTVGTNAVGQQLDEHYLQQQQQQQNNTSAGTPVRMLQLDQSVIQAIVDRCRNVRPDQTAVVDVATTATDVPADGYVVDGGRTVGRVCAKCLLAFPDDAGLTAHQQQCRTTSTIALIHPAYGCRPCGGGSGDTNSAVTFGTVHALRAHIEAAHYSLVQQPNLSDEMEDVVNQITALAAAKAVGRSPSPRDPNSDSNANLFCAPGADKKSKAANKIKFTVPNVTPVPSSGQ
ncbi:zinc finger homeobox protein 3 isoform X2 [Daktulosphaira vitifoliae]|uniref:zinc finger homeobox protein 3 isoform X2 n=1 Tax=Daktulosphaira vitifoliae TaxID=58002 RepID=UPI0021AA9D06|nr:zinc finger homeobox protein 3 isoform X2 [Daktulosphaira vitifoliae]